MLCGDTWLHLVQDACPHPPPTPAKPCWRQNTEGEGLWFQGQEQLAGSLALVSPGVPGLSK